MTEEQKKRYEEVVLEVAQKLAYIAPPYWEQYTKDWPDLAKYHFQRAGELLSLPGIRIEDADQMFPCYGLVSELDERKYKQDNWVKVLPRKEK